MKKTFLLSILIMLGSAGAQEYSGPKCLGSYCLKHPLSDRGAFTQLGAQTSSAHNLFCYNDAAKRAFLFFETFETESHKVADVLVSSFPNCVHMKVHTTSSKIANWKTQEGLGLGSAEADVLKAYGQPTSKTRIVEAASNDSSNSVATSEATSKFVVRGFRNGDKTEKIGDYILSYRSADSTDLRAADFGINKGKVEWIFLSQNE